MKRIKNKQKKFYPCKVIALVALLLLAIMGTGFAISDNDKPQYEIRYDYVVKEGDTLWSIAESNVSEDEDIRDWIRKVQDINGININKNPLHAGQNIVIYRY